jgi:hypothetical protein
MKRKTASKDGGNDGLWKTRKTESRFSIVSHSPWKSLRDSHIPTAPATTAWKSGNPKSGFPLSQRGSWSLTNSERRIPPDRQILCRSGSFLDWNMLIASHKAFCLIPATSRWRLADVSEGKGRRLASKGSSSSPGSGRAAIIAILGTWETQESLTSSHFRLRKCFQIRCHLSSSLEVDIAKLSASQWGRPRL